MVILHTFITQTEYLTYYTTYTYNTNRISDGHIILHTLITQTEYLMVILYYIHL